MSVGRPKVYQSEERAIDARRERQRARYAAMPPEQKREFAARKNARKRKTGIAIPPSKCITKPVVVRDQPETVDQFIARGGRIETIAT